jgi:hypothetical protein
MAGARVNQAAGRQLAIAGLENGEPRHLTTLWASTACFRDSFIFILSLHMFLFKNGLLFTHFRRGSLAFVSAHVSLATVSFTSVVSTVSMPGPCSSPPIGMGHFYS